MNTSINYNHILIIDDSRLDSLLLREIIESLNYSKQLSNFENPISAFNFLKKCTENFPDLIFIDLSMPGINGFQFIERFKREFSNPTKFIIVSSSNDSEDIKMSSKYDNVINYFIKPVNKVDLSTIAQF
jgi:two-component SAPR family response regulator